MIEKDYIKKKIDLFVKELVSLLSKEPPKEEKLKELALLAQKYTEKISLISYIQIQIPFF